LSSERVTGADGQIPVYVRLMTFSEQVAMRLDEAWKRPVRHNRQIERAALWYTLHVAGDCDRLLDPNDRRPYLRPTKGDATARYEAEAAIRTIPDTTPFTHQERQILSGNMDRSNFQFEHGIGDSALGQLALVERWHDWLWTLPDRSARQATPSIDAEVLAVASDRLSGALRQLL
jgi:hypothetical protein